MPDLAVTFVIPIGPAHRELAQRAIASVQAQTVPCALLTMEDSEGRGPGYLRNIMMRQVATPFVSFLDADDWVEPAFAEATLNEWKRIGGNKYIFTDWLNANNEIVNAPCRNGLDGTPLSAPGSKPYCGGTWHVVTTLISTQWVFAVGGFDESLPAIEDTDFYLKLCAAKLCGHHLALPLFHYSPSGGRALQFHAGPDYHPVMRLLTERYGGQMGCCGDEQPKAPIGQRQDGDILAMALWHGNRTEYGRATGRNYPRMAMPRVTWVSSADVQASPTLWRKVDVQPPAPVPEVETNMVGMVEGLLKTAQMQRTPAAPPKAFQAPVAEPPPVAYEAKPDVARVLALAKQRSAGATDEPIFVFSEKQYDSYADIRRLVELSGFESITTKKINAFNSRPYIVVSPEPIPDLNGLKSRVICWQLEYAGEYASNYNGFEGEIWASDKAWADKHNAKYVLMGSHDGLNSGMSADFTKDMREQTIQFDYDVTMLGYMIPRRQAIKAKLADLKWPIDYPGHNTIERNNVLLNTRLMLHVHQHDNAPFVAPQRVAIAAAYRMPMVSETVADPGALDDVLRYASYDEIPDKVNKTLRYKGVKSLGERLHQFLCVENTFRKCVMEALK